MARMKQIPLVLASIAAWCGVAAAQPGPADVAAMHDYVTRNRAYAPAARAEAERRLTLLPELVADPARFELEAAHIVALADNGHSALFPPQWTTRYPRSPVRLGLFSDGLFVIAAPPELAHLQRRRVIAINGRPWREVRTAYSRYQGGERAFRDQFVALFMETPALLAAAGLGGRDRLTLTLADERGRQETIGITPRLTPYQGEQAIVGVPTLFEATPLMPERSIPFYLQEQDRPFRLTFMDELGAAFIQLRMNSGSGLQAFLDDTLAQLRARRPRHIIVDLRFNMGGDLNTTRTFMQALPGLATHRLYAITSGRTFSAGISSLGYLRQAAVDRLRIAGEPVGDRLEFWAEGGMVMLPGLNAMLLTATERHNYRTGCPEPDCHAAIRNNPIRVTSLQPDLPAPLRFADFLAGRDVALEAIRRDIGRPPR